MGVNASHREGPSESASESAHGIARASASASSSATASARATASADVSPTMRAQEITIAVTVYSRRDYLHQAVRSALEQTVPVSVMVVEDCGPDPGMEAFVRAEFGDRIRYHRNPRRRGIFGNWNSCIEQCGTRWLSILHDDDYLQPNFVASMIELANCAGEKGLYWGRTMVIDDLERRIDVSLSLPMTGKWRAVVLGDVLRQSPFSFPGQLLDAALAREFGGFRETSLFSGDFELWAKLIARRGGAQTDDEVAVFRNHSGLERGSSRVYRSGKTFALAHVQRKRTLALYRSIGGKGRFDRRDEMRETSIPIRYLLQYAAGFSHSLLVYNHRLLCLSRSCHFSYSLYQAMARVFGPGFVKWTSRIWQKGKRISPERAAAAAR
jgi:glycosyltransferase involved in cell wall biosynthesis